MRVSEVGEFGLIQLLAREFGIAYPPAKGSEPVEGVLLGVGDDAVVTAGRASAMVWTTDTMVAGEHFLPERTQWRDIGWKALAVNLSDIAAMGATPFLALVTLALPPDFQVDDALDLYRGLHEVSVEYGVTLGGGDIVRSPVFSITVALSGWAEQASGEAAILRRDRAMAGDVVAVTGRLGAAAGGVRLLTGGRDFDAPGHPEAERSLLKAQNRPLPRISMGLAAVRAGVRCGMDVSDGLLQDLEHIATASNVAIRVDVTRVPVSDDLLTVFPDDAVALAVTGGEDYELILIGPQATMDELNRGGQESVTVIGRVETASEPRVTMEDANGKALSFARHGWDHLAAP